jgi:hypothetical protein
VQAICRLVTDPDLIRTFAEKGQTFVRRVHSPDAYKARVTNLFGLRQRQLQHA